MNVSWEVSELSRNREGTFRNGVSGYLHPMLLRRITAWFHRRAEHRRSLGEGYGAYSWAIREISGEARHPSRRPK